jgi:cation diffusion facilitator CzcD-associated flavoprotein CzcO
VSKPITIIIGAGPYGLSLAAHLAARNVEHRIFGHPMLFWSRIAEAGGERYLKSYCFGANISKPTPGFSFADYSEPRSLETFEPCSIGDFAFYGLWFQQKNVGWVEPNDVAHVAQQDKGFAVTLDDSERLVADRVVVATGLSYFAHVPAVLASLPPALVTHTADITGFAPFKDRDVAVIGAGQSALEAAALLHEAGARPQLLVREDSILWQRRVLRERSLWRRLRSPISGLGTGPRAWALTNFPGALHRLPANLRTCFVRNYLPPEGAWWLRERVEKRVPVHLGKTIIKAYEAGGRAALRLRDIKDGYENELLIDHVVAGTGYDIDVERLELLHPKLRRTIRRLGRAPKLNATFKSSAPGLYFIGPTSAMSFGPLFRFVVGAEYTARILSAHLASKASAVQ